MHTWSVLRLHDGGLCFWMRGTVDGLETGHKYYDNGFDTYISTYSPSFICEGGLTGLATSQLSDR